MRLRERMREAGRRENEGGREGEREERKTCVCCMFACACVHATDPCNPDPSYACVRSDRCIFSRPHAREQGHESSNSSNARSTNTNAWCPHFTRKWLKTHLRLDSIVRVRIFTREVCLVDEPSKLPPRRRVLALRTRNSRVSSRTRIFVSERCVRPAYCTFELAALPAGKQGPRYDAEEPRTALSAPVS